MHNLNKMNFLEFHCNALHWFEKYLAQLSRKLLLFRLCYFQAKVSISSLIFLSLLLRFLFKNHDTRAKEF